MGRRNEIYCDRCKQTLSDEEVHAKINFVTIETPENFIEYELCDSCYQKLRVLLDAFEDEYNTFVVQDPYGNKFQEIPGWQPTGRQKDREKETKEIELPIWVGDRPNYGFMEDPN